MKAKTKTNKIRQYALVRLTDKAREYFENQCGDEDPIFSDNHFVFLGDIPNMLGHCVIVGYRSERIHVGYHTSDFQELTEEEV